MEPTQTLAAGLTTFEWLSIVAFFALGEASLFLLYVQGIKDDLASLSDEFGKHAEKDEKHQNRQNFFMGAVCTKLRIAPPPEDSNG